MYSGITKNWERIKQFLLIVFFGTIIILLGVAYKNDQKITTNKTNKTENILLENEDLKSIKEFFLGKILSPFDNVKYKIKEK